MKILIIILFVCLLNPPLHADYIIYFKNGNEEKVKDYRVKNDEICLEMYNGEICFPKTDILKIIKEEKDEKINHLENSPAIGNTEIKKIEPGTENISANSYADSAFQFYKNNRLDDALEMLFKAMESNPSEKQYPKNAGIIYYNSGNFEKAREMFYRVIDIDNKDSFAHEYAGRSFYYNNLPEKALPELNAAVHLDPLNSSLKEFKEKVEKESKIENSFQKTSQEIFLIQYDYQAEFRFTSVILETLLEAYWDIIRDFSYYSKKEFKIPVIIYTREAFKDIKHPEWASAVYDGKIRIPAGSISEQKDKDLENFIYHELTHAILFYYCKGRVIPAWLNEGIAQSEEKNQKDINRVKILLKGKHLFSLKELEKSFSNLVNPADVQAAYAQSYLAVNFILERYSRQALLDILNKLSKDQSIEEAISTTLFIDFRQFEKNIADMFQY
ncbi:MAG: peptidase MA family metallohydrolase [bacterium]